MRPIHSLRVKFSLLLFALLASANLALTWTAARHEASALEAEIEKRTIALAAGLARGAAEPMRTGNAEDLTALLQLAGAQQGVVGARLLDLQGHVAQALDPAELEVRFALLAQNGTEGAAEPLLRRAEARLIAAMRIVDGERPLGEAQVEINLDFVIRPILREAGLRLALVGGGVLALALVAGWSFVSVLVRPLQRLRRGVERLASDDLAVRVPPSTRDEVGELTRAFNELGETLQQKDRIQDAFGRYVSDYVLGQLLHAPEGDQVAGAEREVTIVFVDIRRFTRLSEGMKAQDVVALLNEIFQLVTERLQAHGGTIDKFIGDSVMSYFGAPASQPDHAMRAVSAAVDVLRALDERNRELPDGPGGPTATPIEVGIGIHTGGVVVGNIGSERRSDFTAIGDAVNVASRIDNLAGPGEILISEVVQRLVRGAFRLRFEGKRHLAGRVEPVHVYRVEPDIPHQARDVDGR